MIRDPSDGSVRSDPPSGTGRESDLGIPVSGIIESGPLIDTSTSGLPITKAKADYLARLEESRKWLKEYVRPTING